MSRLAGPSSMVTASSPGSVTVTRYQSPSVFGNTVKGTSPPGVRTLAVPIESLGSKASRLAVKASFRSNGSIEPAALLYSATSR